MYKLTLLTDSQFLQDLDDKFSRVYFTNMLCILFEEKRKMKNNFQTKNYEFSALNFRKEIVPDKLKLSQIENCLFSPNLSTKSML